MKTDDVLENIDSEDIDDLLTEIEKSFEIFFTDAELSSITTFGQLCDLVMEKIKLENVDGCTTQQAFYKLRNAISVTLEIDQKSISTDLPLTVILPHKERRHRTKKLERYLGFKLNVLSPPDWLITTLMIVFVASVGWLFMDAFIGTLGILLACSGFWFAQKVGKELRVETVGQLAKKITKENYVKSRRNPKTYNKNEVVNLLIGIFSENFGLDKSKLTREARLF
ncbi:acyl carrier protein [Sphingobacterium chuzhouense]|uniref:Acyl carrier protein n=1 Tax=Sphingobacterium chuzhouense TaxID=1742264 RepID=A0ABR7XUA2_9SPHI|nr:hypothetical protein [Sphingobacterium chuzhouense]MBD1422620.1 hypothetical protein [Sphingobacterium chuzhouense]